jgi:hypothetical protein
MLPLALSRSELRHPALALSTSELRCEFVTALGGGAVVPWF